MKLNDKYSIEKEAHGFSLVEKTEVKETKDGKETGKIKNGEKKYYYGTAYQALQGFLIISVNDAIQDDGYLLGEIHRAVKVIDDSKDWIKKEFCIEVKKC